MLIGEVRLSFWFFARQRPRIYRRRFARQRPRIYRYRYLYQQGEVHISIQDPEVQAPIEQMHLACLFVFDRASVSVDVAPSTNQAQRTSPSVIQEPKVQALIGEFVCVIVYVFVFVCVCVCVCLCV